MLEKVANKAKSAQQVPSNLRNQSQFDFISSLIMHMTDF